MCYDGREYRLQDGFHRVPAALSLGRNMIEAEVLPPTLVDIQAEFAPMARDNRGRWGSAIPELIPNRALRATFGAVRPSRLLRRFENRLRTDAPVNADA